MAIFNEEYLTEFFGLKKKQKKEYHHLNRNEITSCINIAKECIKEFPKLKKAGHFVNVYKKDDESFDEISPIQAYFEGSGDSDLIIISGDAWDGYSNLKTNPDEFWEDESKFVKAVNEKIEENNIKAKFSNTGGMDWDGLEFAISSLKEK